VTGDDPLLGALREENEQLRAANQQLTDQLAAVRAGQGELAKHFRVTPPLRRVQESLRPLASERRRRASVTSRATPMPLVAAKPALPLEITNYQASRHPLLARTRGWLRGEPLLPRPDIRREQAAQAESWWLYISSIPSRGPHSLNGSSEFQCRSTLWSHWLRDGPRPWPTPSSRNSLT
jgi:hypothetical protein